MGSRSIPVVGHLDLKGTLRPLHGWLAPDGWWLTARTPVGPGTIRIRRTREEVTGDAWGEGADWLLDGLDGLAGLRDDPGTFHTDHPVVGPLHHRSPGLRFGSTRLVFPALVAAIIGQKVTGTEAKRALTSMRRRFGDPAPGPRAGLLLPPDPDRISEAPYWEFHELHLEQRRAEVIRRAARDRETIEALAFATPAEAERVLLGLDGIGPWTVAKTIAVSHGDPDQVEVGDFHLKHIVVHHLTGRPRGSDEEMLALLEEFRPHRGRVVRLLHSLGHEPAYGPRVAPKDITRI